MLASSFFIYYLNHAFLIVLSHWYVEKDGKQFTTAALRPGHHHIIDHLPLRRRIAGVIIRKTGAKQPAVPLSIRSLPPYGGGRALSASAVTIKATEWLE
jgi:hypothetical protein